MSRSGVQHLKTFFLKFPAFSYNAKRPAEKEFCRLWDTHEWEKSSTKFKTIRRQFLKALVKETDSPVHKFFVNQYEEFDYDSGASPRKEFDRLKRLKGWNQFSPPCSQAKGMFEEAFKEDFNSKVDIFFRKFEDFDYNPRASPKLEFRRLKLRRGWGERRGGHGVRGGYERIEKEKAYVKARNEFFRAFGDELDAHFGTDRDGIRTWESLCKALGVDYEPAPTSISQCQKRLGGIYVNICDLLHHVRTKEPFDFFDTEEELSEYSVENDLRFPIREAKSGPLKFILRAIDSLPRAPRIRPVTSRDKQEVGDT